MNKYNQNDDQRPQEEEAEIFDNVPEAASEDESAEQIEESELSEIDSLCKQLAEEKVKLEKEKKEYLFLMAEFDNFRKRTLKEKSELIKNAAESVLKGLLPIVDDFERGLQASATSDDAEAVRQGMELIYSKLVKYLEQNGVKAMDTNGADFDPDRHEAIAMVPAPSEDQKGKVIDTVAKGYTLNGDKVLRFAKVAVGE
ncbi:MAG: nucleotide exchange factor GrpE [Paramuribaculum sp.]|nr:nucleotide exchange factor GrpE [Paramuribaculum sp.]